MNELSVVKEPRRLMLWMLEIERRIGYTANHRMKFGLQFLFSMVVKRHSVAISHQAVNAKVLFFDTVANNRKDIVKMFDDATSTLDGRFDRLKVVKKFSLSIHHWLMVVGVVTHVLRYWRQYYNGISEFLLVVKSMVEILDIKHDADNMVSWNKYRLAVFFYDANTICNYFSQYLQALGIKTATMQHGVMVAPRKEANHLFDFCGIEFEGFVSNYFLAWNEFTRKEAIKSGIDAKKIKVLGNIKCLSCESLPETRTGVFGVILDGRNCERNNVPMLKIANEFAKGHNLKYVVRYHPAYSFTEYAHVIDSEVATVCKRGILLVDFLKNVDFCILGNSTVFFELPYYGKRYYRYSTGDATDKYRDMNGDSFTNFASFSELVSQDHSTMRISTVEERKKYKDFFESFG